MVSDYRLTKILTKTHKRSQNKHTLLSLSPANSQGKWKQSTKGGGVVKTSTPQGCPPFPFGRLSLSSLVLKLHHAESVDSSNGTKFCQEQGHLRPPEIRRLHWWRRRPQRSCPRDVDLEWWPPEIRRLHWNRLYEIGQTEICNKKQHKVKLFTGASNTATLLC